jgi:Ion transport protein
MAKIFYLIKGNRILKGTVQTFMTTLPAMANIGSLILLLILVFSILAVYLFADIKFNGELDDSNNF